jgi:hypothetical protein
MRRFGGEPTVVGRWFALEGTQLQIVGVAEPRFTGVEPGRPTDLWLPYAMYNPRAFGNFEHSWFRVWGRVKENVRLEEAQSVLDAAFTGIRREHAQRFGSNQSPEAVARFVNTPLYVRSAASGPSPGTPSVRAPAVDPGGHRGPGPAHRRLERRESVPGGLRARARNGASSVDWSKPRPLIQQMLVESALVAGAASVFGVLFAGVVAPAVVSMLGSPENAVHLDLVWTGGSLRSPAH